MRRLLILVLCLAFVGCSPGEPDPFAKCSDDAPYAFANARYIGLRHNDIWAYDEKGKSHRLTTDRASSQPTFSPDGSRIAFVSGREGGWEECCGFDHLEIWTMNADGTEQKAITDGPGDGDPAWSPDGELIAFTRGQFANDAGDIYVMSPDGSDQRRVAEAPKGTIYGFPTWSPEGDRIAFIKGAQGGGPVSIVDVESGEIEELDVRAGGYDEIAWSPDGERIAYVRDFQTHLVELESGDVEKMELTSASPQWMPDGTLTYFDRRQDEDGDWGLWQLTMYSDGEEIDVDEVKPVWNAWDEFTPDWPDCTEA